MVFPLPASLQTTNHVMLCFQSPPSSAHRAGHRVDGQCKMLEQIDKGTLLSCLTAFVHVVLNQNILP